MRIVQLNSHLVGELSPRPLGLLEPPHNIVQRRSNPKVLLLQTKFFTSLQVIIGIQHRTDGLCALLVRYGTLVVAAVELLKVEFSAGGFARPETEVVRGGGVVAWDGDVVGYCSDEFAAFPGGCGFAVNCFLVDLAEELDLVGEVSQLVLFVVCLMKRVHTSTVTSWRGNSHGLKSNQ